MSFKRTRILVVALIVILIGLAFWFGTDISWRVRGYQLPGAHRALGIGTTTVQVVVVEEEEDRKKGLSDSAGLAPDEGMLFVFPQEGHYAFWMKDMNYSIDIMWLTASGTIVGIWDDAKPESYPRAYAPTPPAQYVLELPAGFVKGHELKIGDTVRL